MDKYMSARTFFSNSSGISGSETVEERQAIELKQMRSQYLKPKCIKNNRPKGVGYSSLGWLIPCCWMDLRRGELDNYSPMDNPLFAAMFTEELKLSNVDKIEDIIYSEPWKEFGRALLHEPEKCPAECHKYCGSDLPDDGFIYENKEIPTREEAEKEGHYTSSQTKAVNRPIESTNHPIQSISRHYPPEDFNNRAEDDALKRYDRLKNAGMLPRHHYTDKEWDGLEKIRAYHKWAENNNRPIGGAHETKVNFRRASKRKPKKNKHHIFNRKGSDDEDFR